jgi:hypothetical protein
VQPWPRPITAENCRIDGDKDPEAFANLDWQRYAAVDPSKPGTIIVSHRQGYSMFITPEPKLRGKVVPLKLADGKWAWAKKAKEI